MHKKRIISAAAAVLAISIPLAAAAVGGAYVGGETCATCHEDVYAAWEKTAHAHALDTLKEAGSGDDEECLSCHVTGGEGAAYAEGAVSCEACHGPGEAHVNAPDPSTITTMGTEADCRTCHNDEWSPDFDFEEYKTSGIHDVD